MYDLYNLDIFEALDCIKDGSIDLIFTSPPYNLRIEYADGVKDDRPYGEYIEWMGNIINKLDKKLTPNGRICINHYFACQTPDKEYVTPLDDIKLLGEMWPKWTFRGYGFWIDRTLCKRTAWGSWISASAPYLSSPLEGVLIMNKGKWKQGKRGEDTVDKDRFMRTASGYIDLPTSRNRQHPATFPIELPRHYIETLTFKEDTVLDPFMGIGSTGMACQLSGRNFVGIELSKTYFDYACENMIKTEGGYGNK